jgi:signal transduction histidine kinase/CheY-like chemotaxis protein
VVVEPCEVEREVGTQGRRILHLNAIKMGEPGHEGGIFLVAVEDVTEAKRSEDAMKRSHIEMGRLMAKKTGELQKSEEQLRQAQKMEAIGRLAGSVAHDFNNLLTVMMGYSEILLSKKPADHPERAPLEQIRDAGKRASTLTRQLLAFSRKQVLQPQSVNLNTVVEQVDGMLRRLIGEDIELVIRLAPGLGMIYFDPGQIEQIIMNLAVNARDAMPRGGKLVLETANTELDETYVRDHPETTPGPHVMLAVTDTGVGMDAETRARIFEPFFTTKPAGRGTGLGLSTVYGIVKQSGGSIWVYSEPDRGTTFKIYIPRHDKPETPALPVSSSRIPVKGTETILVVEDDAGVRDLVCNVLRNEGYTILVTASPKEALEQSKSFQGLIHLLLTDVVLPQMGGRQLAEALAALRPGLRVLYMSGYTDDAIAYHGILAPGVALLEKPIRPNALAEKVREVLSEVGGSAT